MNMNTLKRFGDLIDGMARILLLAVAIGVVVAVFLGPVYKLFAWNEKTLSECYVDVFKSTIGVLAVIAHLFMLIFGAVVQLAAAWYLPPYVQGILWSILVPGASLTPDPDNGWINSTLLSVIVTIPFVILVAYQAAGGCRAFIEGFKEGRAERDADRQLIR